MVQVKFTIYVDIRSVANVTSCVCSRSPGHRGGTLFLASGESQTKNIEPFYKRGEPLLGASRSYTALFRFREPPELMRRVPAGKKET
ncbi:MAG: hypothetical protein LBD23_18300 [Oscillospiraceae bacterium]|nr:hypothetical protein [Oscillospiraceae bacterium]